MHWFHVTLLNRDSGTDIFLWILLSFSKQFFIGHLWTSAAFQLYSVVKMFKYQFCRNIKLNVQLHSVTLCYKPIGCESLLRSSHPEVFCKKGVLRNFAKFTGKHLCRSLFLIKLQASGDCFWVNFRNLLAYSRGWLSTIWTLSFIFLQNWYWNIFMTLQKLWQNQHTFKGDPTTSWCSLGAATGGVL